MAKSRTSSANRLRIELRNRIQIPLPALSQFAIPHHFPIVRQTTSIRVGIRVDAVVFLQQGYDVCNVLVDRALLLNRNEGTFVLDTGELSDPDWLAVSVPVVVLREVLISLALNLNAEKSSEFLTRSNLTPFMSTLLM